EKGAKGWREQSVMEFTGAKTATDLWAGRTTISRHNTSSPDMIFGAFSDGTMRPPEWKEPVASGAESPAQK
ncbi:MAG: hypothetical protein JNL98_43590, partial [Bryobacterales bacterium]|nr:hypothetical protein [Bryobacterales bacterium]